MLTVDLVTEGSVRMPLFLNYWEQLRELLDLKICMT